jgi:hypothetical protein
LAMNPQQIEKLKSILVHKASRGCKMRILSHVINGRLIGVGFKPYWSGPHDSKIDKLEFNYADNWGKVHTYHICDVVGYDIHYDEEEDFDPFRCKSLDIYAFSPMKSRQKEPYEKIHMELE